jgi:hypothetical protein
MSESVTDPDIFCFSGYDLLNRINSTDEKLDIRGFYFMGQPTSE